MWKTYSYVVTLLLTFCVSLSLQSKCSICEGIVSKFKEGLKKTAKSNFGGGNTRWEEKSLGSYAFSETRLLEILEDVCTSSSECHNMLEQHEENIENWWFKHYAKKKETDLHTYLCIDRVRNGCCSPGLWGPNCTPCPGGKENPCRGAGTCNGAGTREGTGKCSCNAGYQGDECENCSENYFEESKNTTHTQCTACHASCKGGCTEDGPNGCNDCKEGWTETDNGCVDKDECSDSAPCTASQYCTNTEGSYSCIECHKSCQGCSGPGASSCVMCHENYFKDGDTCVACHKSCDLSCTSALPTGCHDCAKGWTWDEEKGCQDINECVDGSVTCGEGEYCQNLQGSHRCSACDKTCASCEGPGSRSCTECKEGYAKEDGACKDIDECLAPDSCPDGEECVNTPGSFRCECSKGFVRRDGICVDKTKPKSVSDGGDKSDGVVNTVPYKGPANCDTCKDIVVKVFEGIANTNKQNFGGGNTKWEEQKLGAYAYSETRFVEVLEGICQGNEKCAHMLEKYEETLESWWFTKFAKEEDPELETWLCVDQAQVCCGSGTFGKDCRPCPGGAEKPCGGNGKCKGDGTRKGTGKCTCDKGYKGESCNECADKYFISSQDDSGLICEACDASCDNTGCYAAGPLGCKECASGYQLDEEKGCLDIDECETNTCEDSEFCDNKPGSFSCVECDGSCKGCTGKGSEKCKECAENYYMEGNKCTACDRACKRGCSGPERRHCFEECRFGYVFVEGEGCVDMNECEEGKHNCPEGKYCENTMGHFQCKKCDSACQLACTGPGPDNCTDCKAGFVKGEDGACVDIDECQTDTHDCRGEGRTCLNSPGSFLCGCEEGYVQKVDKCIKRRGRPGKDKTKIAQDKVDQSADKQTDSRDKDEL